MTSARPQLLLLDFDGLLADYDHRVHLQRLAASAGCPVEALDRALRADGLELAHARGELDADGLLGELNARLGSALQASHWQAARRAATSVRRDVCDVLARVAPQVRVAILSNNGALTAPVIAQLLPDWPVLCSATLGVRKPDPRAYLAAAAHFGATPASSLFVDHLFRNVRGARLAGLHADTAHHAQSLRRLLRRFHLL